MSHAHRIVPQYPSGVSGRSVALSPCPNHKICTRLRMAFPKCMYTGNSFVCKAGSSWHRRNSDFLRQKHGFQGKNRPDEERENFEDPDDSEMFSKNGPLLSLSNPPKFQATARPGPREKEIVELFRKVQSQLRERAGSKEGRKLEAPQGKGSAIGKGSETVDSLLKLLRKHSVDQGKKSSSSSSPMDQSVDRSEENGRNKELKRSSSVGSSKKSSFFNSNNRTMDEVGETGPPALNRPASNFRRKSPVPQVKYKPASPPHEEINNSVVSANSMSLADSDGKNDVSPKPVAQLIGPEVDEEDVDDVDEDEDDGPEDEDLSALNLAELKAMAKSHGLKRYSKMKKAELLELLGSNTSVSV